jgi:hypothetical protein
MVIICAVYNFTFSSYLFIINLFATSLFATSLFTVFASDLVKTLISL